MNRLPAIIGIVLAACSLCCCKHDDMADQHRGKPHGSNQAISLPSRTLVAGTVMIDGRANTDDQLPWTEALSENTPSPFTFALSDLHRGAELFTVYCSPCHGLLGNGDGMIVRRGFSRPPTFHSDRLREIPISHFYNVITNGWGSMYSFNDRITSEDRWRIAAYIRSLQFSQHAPVGALEPQDLARLRTLDAK